MGIVSAGVERYRVGRREVRLALRDVGIAFRQCRRPLSVVLARLGGRRPVTVTLRDGRRVSADDARSLLPLLDEIFGRNEYERHGVAVHHGDVVVDIGAHVGVFSLLAVGRGAARVIAYEPSPANFRHLLANLAANGAVQATVHQAAVGARDGVVRLLGRRQSVGHRVVEATQRHADPDATHEGIEVRSVSIATVFRENALQWIDLLKLDCEGSEGAIFSTASPGDLDRIGSIVMEYHEEWSLLDAHEIGERLGRAGFVVVRRTGDDPRLGMIYARRSESTQDGGDARPQSQAT